MLTAVTGINWGDEGKGRVIDLLAEHADIVARYQGGNNAGHTVVTEQGKFILNLLPSGILHPEVTCVLGAGMVIDLDHLAGEMDAIEARGITVGPENLKLSDKATISMPWHKVQDGLEEDRLAKKGSAFGSTRRGIAYAYSDKYRKKTLRLGDLLHLDEKRVQDRLHMILESKNLELAGCYHQEPMSYDALLEWCRVQAGQFSPYICDVGAFLQQAHDSGKRIVLEAQLGAMRDIDYGIFPFTSSSNTLAAYAPLGAGIPNCKLDHVVGVLKAYSTCVGAGPFAAENAMGEVWNEQLRKAGGEYGAATGRPLWPCHAGCRQDRPDQAGCAQQPEGDPGHHRLQAGRRGGPHLRPAVRPGPCGAGGHHAARLGAGYFRLHPLGRASRSSKELCAVPGKAAGP